MPISSSDNSPGADPAGPRPDAPDVGWARQWYTGARVLVTGGSSGIGASIARGFRDAGADVVATGVSDDDIAPLADDPAFRGIDLKALDVRDNRAVEALMSAMSGLDIVINGAGVIRRGDELDPAVFQSVVDINLNGAMRVASAAHSHLARSGLGAIVNVASMLSFFGGGLVPGYAASKGGIVQLTKSLAIAWADDGIRVNAIAPGWIETPLTAALRGDAGRSAAILDRTPMKRWGKPGDVVGGVLFLCSPAAAFVTGVTLPIDGGYACV